MLSDSKQFSLSKQNLILWSNGKILVNKLDNMMSMYVVLEPLDIDISDTLKK